MAAPATPSPHRPSLPPPVIIAPPRTQGRHAHPANLTGHRHTAVVRLAENLGGPYVAGNATWLWGAVHTTEPAHPLSRHFPDAAGACRHHMILHPARCHRTTAAQNAANSLARRTRLGQSLLMALCPCALQCCSTRRRCRLVATHRRPQPPPPQISSIGKGSGPHALCCCAMPQCNAADGRRVRHTQCRVLRVVPAWRWVQRCGSTSASAAQAIRGKSSPCPLRPMTSAACALAERVSGFAMVCAVTGLSVTRYIHDPSDDWVNSRYTAPSGFTIENHC